MDEELLMRQEGSERCVTLTRKCFGEECLYTVEIYEDGVTIPSPFDNFLDAEAYFHDVRSPLLNWEEF